MTVLVPSKWQCDPIKLSLASGVQSARHFWRYGCRVLLVSFRWNIHCLSSLLHRKEGSALVPIRPLSHIVCPTPAAGALACTGPTTVVYAGMAVAVRLAVHVRPAWPSPAPTANASTGPWCSSSPASAATSATISMRPPCLHSDGSTETHTSSSTSGVTPLPQPTFPHKKRHLLPHSEPHYRIAVLSVSMNRRKRGAHVKTSVLEDYLGRSGEKKDESDGRISNLERAKWPAPALV